MAETKNTQTILPHDNENGRSIPIVKPYTPRFDEVSQKIKSMLASGMLTNGRNVEEFEKRCAHFLGVGHAVAVTNCTAGLIMTLKSLGIKGEILVPSFTFSATGHACFWAGLEPVFVDCDKRDFTISLRDCGRAVSPRTKAVLAVHTFGNPADVYALEEFANVHNLELIFDSAHAFGSKYQGLSVGFGGHAEIFSLTPTKIITAGEGGIIATNDANLAKELKIFRNYGDDGSYDCKHIGFNGRMGEFNAILGTATLDHAEKEITLRNSIAQMYINLLCDVPGIEFQKVYPGNVSSYKDFTLVIDESRFGANRNLLADFLASRGIGVRKYFYPPLHLQSAYKGILLQNSLMEITEYISRHVLSLPIHSQLGRDDIEYICEAIKTFHHIKDSQRDPSALLETV